MSDSLRALIAAALGDMAQTFGQTGALLARRPSDDMLFAQADAALAAIEASGTHVVVPVEPTLAMVAEFARLMWHEPRLFRKTEEQVGAVYRSMLAARPRDAATGEKEGHG